MSEKKNDSNDKFEVVMNKITWEYPAKSLSALSNCIANNAERTVGSLYDVQHDNPKAAAKGAALAIANAPVTAIAGCLLAASEIAVASAVLVAATGMIAVSAIKGMKKENSEVEPEAPAA